MKKTMLALRLLSMIAFVPVLYLLINNLTDNWLYYVCILVIVISFFTIQLLQWKNGEREKVKKTMTAIGFMAFVMILMFFIFLR
ncbi:MAG: hypothetical protein ACO1NX_02020 [Chitinophagaceae bacterium]